MQIMVIQAYQTDDGAVFSTLTEAERHDAEQRLTNLLAEDHVGESWSAGAIHAWLVESAKDLAPILTLLANTQG